MLPIELHQWVSTPIEPSALWLFNPWLISPLLNNDGEDADLEAIFIFSIVVNHNWISWVKFLRFKSFSYSSSSKFLCYIVFFDGYEWEIFSFCFLGNVGSLPVETNLGTIFLHICGGKKNIKSIRDWSKFVPILPYSTLFYL